MYSCFTGVVKYASESKRSVTGAVGKGNGGENSTVCDGRGG